MIVSLLVTAVFYTFIVFITTGVLEGDKLSRSLTPISDAAEVFMGAAGKIALGIAAILAFLSTANAGIMTAARSLVPLSEDGLIPERFGRINARFRTPHNALLVTGLFVLVSLFLRLEILVEAASLVLILTNILACLSVIILRESRIQNYRPIFRTPLYPWFQIAGIIGFCFLIYEMGKEALLVSLLLILAGGFVYWFYGRIRTNREYALLHLIERITAKELTSYSLEEELKEIIRQRDEIIKDRFDHIVEGCVVLDIDKAIGVDEFFRIVSEKLSGRFGADAEKIRRRLVHREKESSTVLSDNLAIPHIVIDGQHVFDVLIARCKEGIEFSDRHKQVRAIFVIVGSKDERNFHLYSLSAIAQIVQGPNFERRWLSAQNTEVLRDIVLLGERKRPDVKPPPDII
jgi:mannitol/fructose-specific phosphotransferase system IIA component (Ntr-type)